MTDRTATLTVYPHTALLNVAHYHRETIKRKLEADTREDIGLDSASCAAMLAFVVEGILNVVGAKIVASWNERWPYDRKLSECCHALKITDTSGEPFTTMARLKALRDEIAHPKPTLRKKITIRKPSEVFAHMDTSWQAACKPDFALEAFAQVDAFERMVLENPRVGESSFTTHATDISGHWE